MGEVLVAVVTAAGAGVGALVLGAAACARWMADAGREAGDDLVAPQGAGFGYATARARRGAQVVHLDDHRDRDRQRAA